MPTLRRFLGSLLTGLIVLLATGNPTQASITYAAGRILDKKDKPTCTAPGASCGKEGMARWRISEPYLNLWVEDEPLGYDPSVGPRVSFLLAYQERGTVDDPLLFNAGVFWNCSWKSYVVVTNGGAAPEVFFPGGGSSVLPLGTYDFDTRAVLSTYLDINHNTNFQADFPDGSRIRYNYAVTNEVQGTVLYFMGDQADPTGQALTFHYTHADLLVGGQHVPTVKLITVVDADGRTNTLAYDDAVGTNLIVSVTDPFSRTNFLKYSQHFLTNITDVAGINSAFEYQTNSGQGTALVSLTTPYGTTTFQHWPQTRPANVPIASGLCVEGSVSSSGTVSYGSVSQPDMSAFFGVDLNDTSRACLVTHPNRAQECYALFMDASILKTNSPYGTNVTMFPTGWPADRVRPTLPISHLPLAADTAATNEMNQAVSFHWNARTYPQLSAAFRSSHSYTDLTNSDVQIGHVKQWLHDTGNSLSLRALNYEREASPDGTAEGRQLWYDYAGKDSANTYLPGAMAAVRSIAETLPSGATNVVFFDRNNYGNVTTRIESWSVDGSGPTLYRTNAYAYATNDVDLVAVTDAAGFMVAGLAYNAAHQVAYFTNASLEVTTNLYNGRGQIQTVQTPAGLVTQFDYGTDRATRIYSAATGTTNLFAYANGLVATWTNSLGLVRNYTWDPLQRLTSVRFPDTSTVSNLYQNLDLQAQKDRLGHWTRACYDPYGFLTQITNALNFSVGFNHCECGLMTEATNELGAVTAFHYDNLGRRTWTDHPENLSVTNFYDVAGRLTAVADPLGERAFQHTVQGAVSRVSTSDGDLWRAAFDPRDLATNAVNRLGVAVTRRFDERGRLWSRALGSNPPELFFYGPAGLVAYTNENGGLQRTLFAHDAAGRLTAETNANLEVVRYAYDGGGHLTNLVDGNSKQTRWEYDAYGRLSKKRDDAGTVLLAYTYDIQGRPATRTTARGVVTTYGFDDLDRLHTVSYSSGDPSLTYNYDAAGRPTTRVDGLGTTTYGFDALGRMNSEGGLWSNDTVASGYTNVFRRWLTVGGSPGWGQTNTYDQAGRLRAIDSASGQFTYGYQSGNANGMAYGLPTHLGLPGSLRATNEIDSLGRLASTRFFSGTTALDLEQYLHDPAFQRTNQVRLDGSVVGYGYDNAGQLTSVTAREAGGTLRQNEQLGYFYDAGGNLNRRTNNALVETFSVNAVNELDTLSRLGPLTVVGTVSPGTTNVSVNGVAGTVYADNSFAVPGLTAADGNNPFTIQSQDSLARSATTVESRYLPATASCTYDADGNLTSDGLRSFSYDAESRLQTVWVPGQWRTDFVYDGLSRRRITTNATWTGSAYVATNVLYAIYDGLLLLQERTTPGVPAITYLRGLDLSGSRSGAGGIGGLLARIDHANARLDLYHADGAGHVTALVSTNGSVVARYLYDPFGTLLASSGPLASANAMRFSSKPWQDAPGLYDFGFRLYDPNLQRWLNQDPIQERGGINLYGFVGNGPVNAVDPDGLTIFPHGFVGPIQYGDGYYSEDGSYIYYPQADGGYVSEAVETENNQGLKSGDGELFMFASFGAGLARGSGEMALSCGSKATEAAEELSGSLAQKAVECPAAKTPGQIGGELSKLISQPQRKLIHDFFGGGVEGAEAALQNLAKGGKLPEGLTREILETYRKIAQNAIDGGIDKVGTQAARLKAIEEALKKVQ